MRRFKAPQWWIEGFKEVEGYRNDIANILQVSRPYLDKLTSRELGHLMQELNRGQVELIKSIMDKGNLVKDYQFARFRYEHRDTPLDHLVYDDKKQVIKERSSMAKAMADLKDAVKDLVGT